MSEYCDVVVVIPALDEEQSLPLVLRDLPEVGRVIVADNGSTDATASVAASAGATVVSEPRKGYGSACLAGLAELEKRIKNGKLRSPNVIVFLDADYSDHPQELPRLVDPILSDEADFVIGSRTTGNREPGALPPQSRYGNWLACTLMRFFFGACYTDLGPFRAIRYQSLCELKMSDVGFGWTIEMQIKAAQHKLRIAERPVSYRCRIGTSKITGTVRGCVGAGTKILFTIAKYAWPKNSAREQRSPETLDVAEQPSP